MKSLRRTPSAGAEPRDGASLPFANMNKGSALTRRAALLTAIVMVIAIAAGLFAYGVASSVRADQRAREGLLPAARRMAAAAASYAGMDADAIMDQADIFAVTGGTVWLTGTQRAVINMTDELPMPEQFAKNQDKVFEGEEFTGFTEIDSRRCAWAMTPVLLNGKSAGVLTLAVPVKVEGPVPILVAILLAAAAGCAGLAALAQKVMRPAVEPIEKLRDAAVAMGEGNLDVRADETAPAEIGQLAQAVNHLSNQLSRHMYMLIVERNRLKNMLNGLSEGIVAIDAEGRVTHTNPAMEKFFTPRKVALHLPDPRMKLIPDKSIWEDFDSVLKTVQPTTRTLESRDMVLRITVTPIVDEIGAIAGAVGLFSDITQQERLERTRREYVSNVSHELRTPLTALRALIEPLKEGMVKDEPTRQHYYDVILRETLRLSRLIDDQLELSRLQSGTLSIQKEEMPLEELVMDICDRYSAIAAKKKLELKVETDFSACPTVYTNPDRVEQMLIILLDNAIKYTEQGYVAVSGEWNDDAVTLHVRDTGIGIEEADLPYVFDRFYKVDKAHSGKGSGLGLSIAWELMHRMDEELWVESEKGVGTCFSFTLHRPVEGEKGEEQGDRE